MVHAWVLVLARGQQRLRAAALRGLLVESLKAQIESLEPLIHILLCSMQTHEWTPGRDSAACLKPFPAPSLSAF